MLACNRLRIDTGHGFPVTDYRIENGWVESRTLRSEVDTPTEVGWQRLTPEQISSHVMADTVVAYWLRRKMGTHRLLRACAVDNNMGSMEFAEHSAA